VGAALLLARTLQRGEAAGAGAFVLVQRAVHGQLAAAAFVGALAIARGGRLLGRSGRRGRGGLGLAHRRATAPA
jgi:hypothetical protein